MRKYVRHQAGLPIEILEKDTRKSLGQAILHNVSLGGLECESGETYEMDTIVVVQINLLRPAYEVDGRIVWMREEDDHFVFGVQFFGEMDSFRLRMIEQISHIEHYRNEVRQEEGRKLTGEEAAREWINLYAADFP